MPSPTDRTWPTSLTCASAPKFWISRFRIAEISAGWISILVSSHGGADAGQFGAKGRIDHARAHLDDQTAKQSGIDMRVQARLAAELGLENGFELRRLGGGQSMSRSDLGFHFALQPRHQPAI